MQSWKKTFQDLEIYLTLGAIDFSQAERTADGRLCVIKETTVDTIAKDPILECVHKNIEKCHYTYVTQFIPAQEEGKTGFKID